MPTKGKYLAVWGLILQLGFIVGIVGTIYGMLNAFALLPDTSASHTQEALASDIALALRATTIGMIISLVGAVLLCIALFGSKYRALWFRTAMWIMAFLWLLSGPVGIILGIFVMIYLSNHKNEFTEQGVAGYGAQSAPSPER